MSAEGEIMTGKRAVGNFPKDKIGQITASPPGSNEVEGRAILTKRARCAHCGAIGYINFDTLNHRAYQCCTCSVFISF